MKVDVERYFEEPMATKLEVLREIARKKKRLTYDCYNTIVPGNLPTRVTCRKGKLGGKTMPLACVLRGMTALCCRECRDYNDGRLRGRPKKSLEDLLDKEAITKVGG